MKMGGDTTDRWRLTPKHRVALAALLLVVAVFSYLRFGPHVMDDAYITYRYAAHMAEGHGPVYNVGERVFGYSNPLFMMMLGVLGRVGIPIPGAGLAISALCGALTLALLIIVSWKMGMELAGWFAALFLSLQQVWVVILVSGMESMLYSALLLAMFCAVGLERWRYLGVLAALVCLVRYDGVLACLAAFAVCAWRGGFRIAFVQGFVSLAIFAPWLVFAWVYYGTPVPQTIPAKEFLYVLTLHEAWVYFRDYYIVFQSLWPLWLGLMVWGTAVVTGRKDAWIVLPLWAWGFAMFYLLKRVPVLLFPWYLQAALAVLIWLGCVGLWDLARRLPRYRLQVFSAISLVLLVVQFFKLGEGEAHYGVQVKSRESYYRDMAEALRPMMQPGQSVLTAEVGAIGWYLPRARIIDGVGLLSDEALEIRKRDRELLRERGELPQEWMGWAVGGTMAKVWMLEELQPDYFTARKPFIPWEGLKDHPALTEKYERLKGPEFEAYDMVAFRRKR